MRKKGSIGCLGCAAFIAMPVLSVLLVVAILWLNPRWFDYIAFWCGPRLAPEVILIPGLPTPAGSQLNRPVPMQTWEAWAQEAEYTPEQGASLSFPEGTRIEFPPGSIRSAERVRAVPITRVPGPMSESTLQPVGPIYDIRVGTNDHYVFNRPVRMTVPIPPSLTAGAGSVQRLAFGTWENGRWVELPSRFSPDQKFISAELPHASVEGLLAILVLITGGKVSISETGRGLYQILAQKTTDTYDSTNFAIHYFRNGPGAVPSDAEYPLTSGRSISAAPWFVFDIAQYLELSLAHLDEVGMPMSRSPAWRWDVFLVPMKELGATDCGGPVMLNCTFKDNNTFPADLDEVMRRNATHELIHVAQKSHFGSIQWGLALSFFDYSWWAETSAAYLADRFWELRAHPTKGIEFYLRGQSMLPLSPLNEAKDPEHYAYASFLKWLEKTGKSQEIVNNFNAGDKRTLEGFDKALGSALPGKFLSETFMDFTKDFYYNTLYSGEFYPAAALVDPTVQCPAPAPFVYLAKRAGANTATVNVFGEWAVPMKHLSAVCVNFHTDVLPKRREARLVAIIDLPDDPEYKIRSWVAELAMDSKGPVTFPPRLLMPLTITERREIYKSPRRIAAPHEEPIDFNRVMMIFVNSSLTKDMPSVKIRRWLLMAPEYVMSQRQTDKSYKIDWHRAELKDHVKAFLGYNVYRRKKGESDFTGPPINLEPLTSETYIDHPFSDEDYVYTVKVVDVLKNESAPAPILEVDPFQGFWIGKVTLLKGEVKAPVMKALNNGQTDYIAREQKRIAAISDQATRQSEQRIFQENKEFYQKAIDTTGGLLGAFELLFHAGVPIRVEVSLSQGEYFLKLKEIGGMTVTEDQEMKLAMKLSNPITLEPKNKLPQGAPSCVLQLNRQGEIDVIYDEELIGEKGERTKYTLRLFLQREKEPISGL